MQDYFQTDASSFRLLASWSSGNALVPGAADLRFKSWRDQIDTVLPTARHRCDISLNTEAMLPGHICAEKVFDNWFLASA